MDLEALVLDLQKHPESYTYWFRFSFDQFLNALEPRQTGAITRQVFSHG